MKLLHNLLAATIIATITIQTTILNVYADDNTSQYKIEVFSDCGKDSGSGERTRNTGYNERVQSARFNNKQYDAVPVIDVFAERVGLDWANYSYFGGRHYSYEAFKVLKDNGCEYVLLYLGRSPWNEAAVFNKRNCKVYTEPLKTAIENATKANVKIGLIWEGNAVNSSFAYDEADYVYKLISDNNLDFDLPLFYAPEYSSNATAWEDRTLAVQAFFTRLKYNNYNGSIGLYTNGFTNQGAVVDANKLVSSIPDLCLWVPAYDNYPNNRPNFDNILYMHQYTGDYGVVPAREHTMLNGIGYMLDISMVFVERPDDTIIYPIQNYICWDEVEDADAYKLVLIHSDYTRDEIILNEHEYKVTEDVVKAYVKAIKTDKYGFTAESYNWAETSDSWKKFDFSKMDLSEYNQKTCDKDFVINTETVSNTKYTLSAYSKGVCYDLMKSVFGNN